MWKALIKKKKSAGKRIKLALGVFAVLFVIVCYQNLGAAGAMPNLPQFGAYIREEIATLAFKNCMMVMIQESQNDEPKSYETYLLEKIASVYPVYGFSETLLDYDTQIESKLTNELVAENKLTSELEAENEQEIKKSKESEEAKAQEETGDESVRQEEAFPVEMEEPQADDAAAAQIPREKLNDFDYLLQNFYQVDRTTTIDGSQLNAEAMLAKSMKLEGGSENVQILIYHTHSQEGYADSAPGDSSTSVVGVAEYLTTLLRDKYGFNVMHHTGEYDVIKRDDAYSYAGPALEQILAENPSIEVVIDLHRDGVADTTRLVSEVNGKQTAQIMFFNGLSRTTSNGDIAYLANPNLDYNLAFSFQLKLAAEEKYPGFARANYLKGYRYNLHYRPKSLLVEVGAQTNTLEEAMNAMEPLADILHKVLSGEG